jgi:hypothetical protein
METCFTPLRVALVAMVLACASSLRAEEKLPSTEPVPPSILKRYDRNKDGALDENERAKWESDKAAARAKYQKERAEMLERFDTNKDGRISEEERAAAKLAMERMRIEQEGERMKERAAKAEQKARAASAQEAEKPQETTKPAADQMGEETMMME